MTSHSLTVRGVPMRWEEVGDGPAVVLLHGIPTSPALWRHVLPHLQERARCLAFELVGFGQSIPAGVQRDLSLSQQAEYLLAWLDAMEIERAVFAGHDLGGGVAQIAAVRAPERCAGLVLTNAVGYDSWPIPSVKMLKAASPVLRQLPPRTVQLVLATLVARGHDNVERAKESLELHKQPYLEHDGAAALARQVSWLHVRDTLAVADRIRELDVPAQVVWGAADQLQKVDYGERFAWDLRTTLWRIEGGKHFTPEDHPETIAKAVLHVLDDG